MDDDQYMKLAIEEAKKSLASGGAPIGAVIVKDDHVIATGWSMVWPKKDPLAHPEAACIKSACQESQSLDLSGCTLFSTLEPCSLCLGCASWTGLSKIVFGAYKEDIAGNPYELAEYHAEEHAKRMTPMGGGTLVVVGGVLREECAQLMKNYKNWSPMS